MIHGTRMNRLTITLAEVRRRALKESTAQRRRTTDRLIDESLEFYGIKAREDAMEIVRPVRRRGRLSEDEALLAEYRAALLCPAICKPDGPGAAEVDAPPVTIAQNAIVPAPGTASVAPDSGDQFPWGLLATRLDLLRITGDRALLEHVSRDLCMRSANHFLDNRRDGPP